MVSIVALVPLGLCEGVVGVAEVRFLEEFGQILQGVVFGYLHAAKRAGVENSFFGDFRILPCGFLEGFPRSEEPGGLDAVKATTFFLLASVHARMFFLGHGRSLRPDLDLVVQPQITSSIGSTNLIGRLEESDRSAVCCLRESPGGAHDRFVLGKNVELVVELV